MKSFKSIKDITFQNKTVILRVDLNVPAQRGRVTDTTRIDRIKPTIDYLRNAGAKILILSHFGRPEGEQNPEMSMAFLLPVLKECWGVDISFSPDCIGERAKEIATTLKAGDIALLENVRFYKEEKANDPTFAATLASLGDIYVNDAFSTSHRAHASTEGIAHLMPSVAGLLMEEELKALDKALGNPEKPVAAIAGGSKISTKLSVLNNLIEKADFLILGGGMANTFLYANGADVGSSLCEKGMAEKAREIMAYAKNNNCEIILPIDLVSVTELKENAEFKILPSSKIPEGRMAIDTGPESIKYTLEKIKTCKTILWNGPMGVFEIKPFDNGTNALAKGVAKLTNHGDIVSIAGGGDTIAALENAGVAEQFSYISTAGGAFLEWLKGKTLPGVAALSAYTETS
ncbi:MAG: phosphoglycerate kinase [Alphaproteobacteria bacterium]|nr:phosphoglycerate kinase [Alphaproteobacteria bacterium]